MLDSVSKWAFAGALIATVVLLVWSAPARAVPVDVVYNIQVSLLAPATGANTVVGPGSLTVRFGNGTPAGHVSAGTLHVRSGTGAFTSTFTVFGLAQFTGFQNVNFPGSGAGAVTPGGGFNLTTVGHIASGSIHCTGIAAGGATFVCIPGGFVPSVPQALTSGPRTLNVTAGTFFGFPSLGPQSFTAMGTGGPTPQGGNLILTLTGQEVGRSVVPEPSTALLVGLGLAGLGLTGASWRRAHRA